MKNYIARMTGLISMTAILSAAAAHSTEVTVGADVASAYVWRGITLNDQLVVQPELDVVHPLGIGFNVWGNYDVRSTDDVDARDFQEIDLTVSYALPIKLVDISIGLIDYTFPGGDSSTVETYVTLEKGVGKYFSIGVEAYYDIDEVRDYYLSGGIGLSVPVAGALDLNFGASIGYAGADMSAGDDSGFHDYNILIAGALPLGESFEIAAFAAYTGSLDTDVLPNQKVDFYGGIGLHHSF